jgi:hypothetical protein
MYTKIKYNAMYELVAGNPKYHPLCLPPLNDQVFSHIVDTMVGEYLGANEMAATNMTLNEVRSELVEMLVSMMGSDDDGPNKAVH